MREPRLRNDDALQLIIRLCYGSSDGSALVGQKLLSKLEICNAFRGLPEGANVSVVNTACFSEQWEGLANGSNAGSAGIMMARTKSNLFGFL